ncbi:hypothetical protein SLA2020_518080 [Shorea laevis]
MNISMGNNNVDSSTQNWLAFSLSNPHFNLPSPSSDSSHLCLFEAFTNSTTSTSNLDNVVERGQKGGGTTGAMDLSIFTGGPKLEDFLGSSTGVAVQPPQLGSQFPTETSSAAVTVSDTTDLYESELKGLAARFLRGYSTGQTNAQKQQQLVPAEPTPKRTVDTFGQRTSIYRGVTRHRWTGRYEAHLWDNSCRREGQSRKGRQVYLGGYDKEEKAARAYDLAALKYWGPTTTTNFPVSNYEKELEEMKNMTRQEFVASLRRKSSGFSRGASIYRGVTRHHQHGRWQARIGRVAGNKDLYLGTFSTQEEAAEAYDIAAIKFRGLNAVTNFDISRYDVQSIANSKLPIGGMNKSKNSSGSTCTSKSNGGSRSDDDPDPSASSVTFATCAATPNFSFAIPLKQGTSDYWSNVHGFNAAKNSNVPPVAVFQSSGSTSFSMEFAGNSAVSESNSTNTFNGGGYAQEQSVVLGSSIPLATPIPLNGSSGNSHEGSSGYGSWIAESLHSYQAAKPSLSAFQTPIFGME